MKRTIKRYDIIGDVHGYGKILEQLLQKLGYKDKEGFYCHSERIAIFLGDLIDRGPENFRVLKTVKNMVDGGSALIVMGNHEYNALCFHTESPKGGFLRPHTRKNIFQHKEVLAEIEIREKDEWNMMLDWFRRMPLFLELDRIRIVHACWHLRSIDFVKNNKIYNDKGQLTDQFLISSAQRGTKEFQAVENLLKGLEVRLPENHSGVYDKEKILRKQLRLKWWMDSVDREDYKTYDQIVRAEGKAFEKIKGLKIPQEIKEEMKDMWEIGEDHKSPVFFGHYWFSGSPHLLNSRAACLDYSLARRGKLVCYRWDGEQTLNSNKFVWVSYSQTK